jgi:hypothetical protein
MVRFVRSLATSTTTSTTTTMIFDLLVDIVPTVWSARPQHLLRRRVVRVSSSLRSTIVFFERKAEPCFSTPCFGSENRAQTFSLPGIVRRPEQGLDPGPLCPFGRPVDPSCPEEVRQHTGASKLPFAYYGGFHYCRHKPRIIPRLEHIVQQTYQTRGASMKDPGQTLCPESKPSFFDAC